MSIAIVWFRRDLRLHDNPALTHAVQAGHSILPLYIHAPNEEAEWTPGAASRWWLHHSLTAFGQQLQQQHIPLTIISSHDSLSALQNIIQQTGAVAVYWNRCYEPLLRQRDQQIKTHLRVQGVQVYSANGYLLNEPWEVETQQHTPYKVFTPYWRVCQKHQPAEPLPIPSPLIAASIPELTQAVSLEQLALLPRIPWASGFTQLWTVGELGAMAQLTHLCNDKLHDYHERRDLPSSDGISRLSPYLHFGEISPRQLYHTVQQCIAQQPECRKGGESFLRQLYWREFAWHLLYHFPHTVEQPLNLKYQAYPWATDYQTVLNAWQQGRTGYPIVDAGMRELWHTGWMHNRVRMIVASLLTKNARIPWQLGAQWFWDTLVDADLANNSLGWQWVAGCGADAAPYYRIFNPYTQSEKFDPQGQYLRRWLPELATLDNRSIHNPSVTQLAELAYPAPIIDYKSSREAALAGYEQIK